MTAKGIPVVHTFNESVPLWKMHRDNGAGHECSHYCFPGAPVVRLCPAAAAGLRKSCCVRLRAPALSRAVDPWCCLRGRPNFEVFL